MSKNIQMTQGHPAKLMLSFALPLMAGNVFQQLYTVVDTAIVGQGVGLQALAALGAVDWLNWMMLGIIQGFTQGFGVKMSKKYGQGDGEGLKKVIGVSAVLSVLITVVLLTVSQASLGLFLQILRVPDDLADISVSYTRILFAGLPAVMFFNFCAGVLRSVGDSRTPLRAMIAASLTNIVLDLVAVFVLKWGVAGAALATVISQCLSGFLCAYKIASSPLLRFAKRDCREWSLAGPLLLLGVPIALQNVIISVGGMLLQSLVNEFGTAFIAGFTATNKLYGILEIAAISYGFAITTYVGQNYGAGAFQRIRTGVSWSVLISVLTSAVIAAVMLLFGRQITMLFISADTVELELEAGETAYRYLCVMSLSLPVLYLLYVYRSALQGMGNTLIPMLSGVAEFVMRVGIAFLTAGFYGWKEGLYLAEVSAWAGAALLLSCAYFVSAARLKQRQENPL